MIPPWGIVAYLLFFVAGIGFGYAAPARWKWLPLLFPLLLGSYAIFNDGVDATILIRLIVALIVTALGILAGIVIDAHTSGADHRATPEPSAAG